MTQEVHELRIKLRTKSSDPYMVAIYNLDENGKESGSYLSWDTLDAALEAIDTLKTGIIHSEELALISRFQSTNS